VAAFCAILGPATVQARGATTTPKNTAQNQAARHSGASPSDETAIRTAAETAMSQVDLGKVAEQKAQNPEVKKFAQRMVEEHSKLTEELKQLGTSEHIRVPTSVNRSDANAHRQLAKESGAGFDKSYTQQVAAELEKAIAEFKRGASTTTKPALKEFFERNQATLESESQQAKQLGQHAR
jgi:putative membrane protein